jgi:hypothetical protein
MISAVDPNREYSKIAGIAGINQRERTPAPKSQRKLKRIEGAGSFPGRLEARSFSFLIIEVPICER